MKVGVPSLIFCKMSMEWMKNNCVSLIVGLRVESCGKLEVSTKECPKCAPEGTQDIEVLLKGQASMH